MNVFVLGLSHRPLVVDLITGSSETAITDHIAYPYLSTAAEIWFTLCLIVRIRDPRCVRPTPRSGFGHLFNLPDRRHP